MSDSQWPVLIHLWLLTAWRKRYFMLSLMILFPLVGAVVGMLKPDQFESRITILIQEAAKYNPFLKDLAVETRIKDRISALDALLHSRHVLGGVAADLGKITPATTDIEREDILRRLSVSLRLRLIGNELVELSIRQSTKDHIVRTLNAVSERFVEEVMAPEKSSMAGSVRFLEEQLRQSAEELTRSEDALSVFLTENADHLPKLHASNMQHRANRKLMLSEKKTDLEGAKAYFDILLNRLSQTNPVVTRIEQKIVQFTAELAWLRSRYTNEHSAIAIAEHKLLRLTDERNALIVNAPALRESEVEALWHAALQTAEPESGIQLLLVSQIEALQEAKARVADFERQVFSLEKEVSALDRAVVGYGSMGKSLRRLEREVNVKEGVYKNLMERAEMAHITGALSLFEAPERIKIIDQPIAPTRPLGLPILAYVAGGVLAGLLAALGIVVLSEITDTTLRRRDHVKELLGLPIITRVPYLAHLGFDYEGLLPDGAPRRRQFSILTGRV